MSPCWASHLFCTMDDLELNLPPSQPGCWDHYSCTLLTSCGLDIDFGALCNTLATDFVIFCFFFVPVWFNFERHCSQPRAAQSGLELVTFLAFVSQELGRQGCATIFTCLVWNFKECFKLTFKLAINMAVPYFCSEFRIGFLIRVVWNFTWTELESR